jgi:thiamine transport system ATP-binding protein
MLELDALAYAHPSYPPYSFTLRALPGEVTAITGPSGSGKSTLLDLIAGFLKPTSGRLQFEGKDLLPLTPEQRPVSILFQSDLLFEHLTATHNVALGLPRTTRGTAAKKAVADALAEVGLPDIGRQRASTLSGGQKQRVALARTLLRNRPILLLDEPFSALDDATRAEARLLVRTLTERHKWTTLLVTHQVEDVAVLAARRYRISDGVLLGS